MAEIRNEVSEKGRQLIVIDKFKFSFQKTLSNGAVKRWACTNKKSLCKAFVKTEGGSNTIIESSFDHNHDPCQDNLLERQFLSNKLKRKATENVTERPMKILREELRSRETEENLTTTDVRRIKTNMYWARRAKMPGALPKSMGEVHDYLENYPATTNKNENFLLRNDKNSNIIMISCKKNLEFLADHVKHIYLDGTFDYCCKFFTQLFTVHGLHNGHYIPLIYFLLPNKLTISYTTALRYLEEECVKIGKKFVPAIATVDFEMAIHKAIMEIYPSCTLQGCRFHLGQSWYRKIQELGLSSVYNSHFDSEVKSYLTYIFGLPLLNPEDVGDCFAIDLAEIQPRCEKVTRFADYLVQTYITEDAIFPPHIWAQHSSSLERTTNACESFHQKLNSSFYSAHPNIFLFINELINVQVETYIKMRSALKFKKMYAAKTLKKQMFLQHQIESLNRNEMTKFQFIKNVSHHFRASK